MLWTIRVEGCNRRHAYVRLFDDEGASLGTLTMKAEDLESFCRSLAPLRVIFWCSVPEDWAYWDVTLLQRDYDQRSHGL